MQSDGCILCPEQYKFIWNTSWSSLASVTYAIYRGHYSLSMVPGSVLLSSLNYWRLPNSSFRKYLDMSVVAVSLSYQLFRSIGAQHASLHYLLMMISIACYPAGIFFYNIGECFIIYCIVQSYGQCEQVENCLVPSELNK